MSINLDEFLSRHDLIWGKQNVFLDEAAFIGNGMIGARILNEENVNFRKMLRFILGRNDVVKHRSQGYAVRVPIGELELFLADKVNGETTMRQDLYNAEFTANIATALGKVWVRCFTHKLKDIIVIETIASENELAKIVFIPEGEVDIAIKHSDGINITQYIPEAKISRDEVNGITLITQDYGEGDGCTFAFKEVFINENHHVFYGCLMNKCDDEVKTNATLQLQHACDMNFDEFVKSHRDWWHDFYSRSFISIPETRLEGFYWIQLYKLACATREDGCVIDNQGPWTAPTPWPGTWYNMNVQLAYAPVYTSNHLQLGESLCNKLDENLENLINNVQEEYRYDSAGLGRCSSHDMVSPLGSEIGNLTWACHNYYRQCKYSADNDRLINKFFPLLKRSVNYYLHILIEDENKALHLPKTTSPEYGSFMGLTIEDITYDLALLKWGLSVLIDLNQKFNLNDESCKEWNDVLSRLTDYHIDHTGYMIGKDVALTSGHRHYSHLFPVYPLHLIDTDKKENWDLAYKSLKHWYSMEGDLRGFTFIGASTIAATLGLGDEALAYIMTAMHFVLPNTMYKEAGPVLESSIGIAEALNYMLLQSHNDIIRVFPAIPTTWREAVFEDLCAEGGFLISAKRTKGNTAFIKIKSCVGGTCTIKSDMKNAIIHKNGQSTLAQVKGTLITLDTQCNEEIIISNRDYNGSFEINPIKVQPHLCNYFGQKKPWRLYGLPTTL